MRKISYDHYITIYASMDNLFTMLFMLGCVSHEAYYRASVLYTDDSFMMPYVQHVYSFS